MENNFKGTGYDWSVGHDGCSVDSGNITGRSIIPQTTICTINTLWATKEEVEANAQLIADAGNVRQQIPFDLPELLNQRNELLEMVKILNQVNPSFSLYDEAKKLITKCEGSDNG